MNIEILGSLLSLYKNKQSILYYYVSDCSKDIIKNAILYDPSIDELHDNDIIYVLNNSEDMKYTYICKKCKSQWTN